MCVISSTLPGQLYQLYLEQLAIPGTAAMTRKEPNHLPHSETVDLPLWRSRLAGERFVEL